MNRRGFFKALAAVATGTVVAPTIIHRFRMDGAFISNKRLAPIPYQTRMLISREMIEDDLYYLTSSSAWWLKPNG